VSIFSAAKRLASYSGWSLSNLKIQKLIYLAHMFYMGRNDGDPLVSGRFEAWDYGPVNPDLYHLLKIYGANPVGNIFRGYPDVPDDAQGKILDEVYDAIGDRTAGKLVAATHRSGGAWEKHYSPGKRGISIPNDDIFQEYVEMFGNNA